MSSLEEGTKGYHLERERYALDAEKKGNMELLKCQTALKGQPRQKKNYFKEMFTGNIDIKFIFTYLMI